VQCQAAFLSLESNVDAAHHLMPLGRANTRWIRAIVFGILAELATAVSIIIVVAIHSVATGGPMVDTTSPFAYSAGEALGIIGGALLVYLFARWLGQFLAQRFIAHGLVVAGAAAIVHLVSTLGSLQSYDLLHLSADVLKLVAGALAGWQASRIV